MLARAFFEDRIYRWLVPADEERLQSAHAFFGLFAGACSAHHSVFVVPGFEGAALWLPPGRQLIAEADAEAFGERLLATTPDGASRARMIELVQRQEEIHPAAPHWYLAFMGVDSSHQGRGVGSALLSAVLQQADREGQSAYLEASSPENQRLYQRHGFDTIAEFSASDSPPLFAMWRKADS